MNIVVIGFEAHTDTLRTLLDELGAKMIGYADKTDYIARLATDHAALILVDAGVPDWEYWAVVPKTSPATRRIPVVVVTDSAAQADEARRGGANQIIAPAELLDSLPRILDELARVISPQTAAALIEQCGDPLPPEAREAIERFNAGDYYRQHDLFEALWMQDTRPVRDLYRAVLQIGIAYYQITRGNWRGAHKMLLRSLQWLALLPDECQGIDVARLRADADAVRAELERVGADGIDKFDRSLLKPVIWKREK